jgi:hypothetical protein
LEADGLDVLRLLLLAITLTVVTSGCGSEGAVVIQTGGFPALQHDRERELERLHAGLLKLAALPDAELRVLVGSLLADMQDE